MTGLCGAQSIGSYREYRNEACTRERDNSGRGIIVHEEHLVQIGLIIAEILLFVKCDLDQYFQCQLM